MVWITEGLAAPFWVDCSFDPADFVCADFTCCFPPVWFCCPHCHDASTRISRVGPVGVRGIDDSRRFFCEACGLFFTMGGETFWEAHGRLE